MRARVTVHAAGQSLSRPLERVPLAGARGWASLPLSPKNRHGKFLQRIYAFFMNAGEFRTAPWQRSQEFQRNSYFAT